MQTASPKPEIVQDHLTGLWYRPESYDYNTIRSIKDYNPLLISAGDKVLDIGGHIGAFSRWAAGCGADVVTYEPAPGNFKLLKKNLGRVTSVELHNAAVVAHGQGETEFYLNKGMNHGLHSSVERRGRDVIVVNAANIINVLKSVKPTVMKVDCEGAEYELFQTLFSDLGAKVWPAKVRALAVEWHFSKHDWKETAVAYSTKILSYGFEAVRSPKFTGKDWATVAVYRKKQA